MHSRDNSCHYQNLTIIARSHKDILTGVMVSFDTHEHAHMHTPIQVLYAQEHDIIACTWVQSNTLEMKYLSKVIEWQRTAS